MHTPFLSVCIPVYNTEQYLTECLKSVIDQDFADYEILVLSDSSSGHDQNGRDCKAIVKSFKKPFSKPSIRYLEHSGNKGLVEARRTLVYEARGEYICMLDSDDFLAPGALALLANTAKKNNYDIVQGKAKTFWGDCYGEDSRGKPENDNEQPQNDNAGNVFLGELCGKEIFHSFFVEHKISSFLWGKIIHREVYLQALNEIPSTYCNTAEDFLQFFFITRFAKSYFGTQELVYYYRKTSGMTSAKKIDTIRSWEMVCSTASVFTILFDWNKIDESTFRLTPEEHATLQQFSQYYIKNNYRQYTETVIPQLKAQAYELLCEYWGEGFVKRVEKEFK